MCKQASSISTNTQQHYQSWILVAKESSPTNRVGQLYAPSFIPFLFEHIFTDINTAISRLKTEAATMSVFVDGIWNNRREILSSRNRSAQSQILLYFLMR